MSFDTILFDLDGTLTDPSLGITNSIIYALKKFGIEETDRKKLHSFIGPPLSDAFENYYGFSKEKSQLAVKYYREYFAPKGLFENSVFEGVEEMLKTLKDKGKKLIIATSKPQVFADEILKHFNLYRFFDFVVGSNLDGSLTKKSQVIAKTLEILKPENKRNICMVGDRMHDMQGATQNGITPVGVSFGFGSIDELKNSGAEYIINSVLELTEFLIK